MWRTAAVIRFRPDGTILDASPRFLAAMGYAAAEITGRHHRIFCEPELVASPEYEAMWERLSRGEQYTAEVRRLGKGGRLVVLQATYAPVYDEAGRIESVLEFATDITEHAQAQARLRAGMGSIREVVAAARSGDFRRRVQLEGSDLVADMAASIDEILDLIAQTLSNVDLEAVELSASIRNLQSVSAEMKSASDAATASTHAAREAATEIDGKVDEMVRAATRLHAGTAEMTKGAQDAASVASSAVQSTQAVENAVERLGEESERIRGVVKTIHAIAQQTNLLALNATIEAARVGEAGKGFAVVAHEVKELAKGSAAASEDISQRIEAIRSSVLATSESIREVVALIERIGAQQVGAAEQMKSQNAATEDIQHTLERVADRTKTMVKAVEDADQHVGVSESGARTAREAAQVLAALSQGLHALTARFTFDGDHERAPLGGFVETEDSTVELF